MAELFLDSNFSFSLEGLRQAPRTNQPFVPNTAPVRQTRSLAQIGTPLPGTPSWQITPGSSSNTVEEVIDSVIGEDTMTLRVSTRDVPTPGNRPEQFRSQGKEVKQFDYHDPTYPLHFLQVSRGEHTYISCCIHAYSQ